MAYRGRRQMNALENRNYETCQLLRIPYPPDPLITGQTIQIHKTLAEQCLKRGNLQEALMNYTYAMLAVEMFPHHGGIQEELYKLRCNRSLVHLRMRRYDQAEDDATTCIALNPTFLKGYWRAAQAVKTQVNGIHRALMYVKQGLAVGLDGFGSHEDVTLFLTELCTLVPVAPRTEKLQMLMSDVRLPDESYTWKAVMQKLSVNEQWDGIAMLVLGEHNGPTSALDGRVLAGQIPCTAVSVGSLLLTTGSLQSGWSVRLAVELLKLGASVNEIGLKFRLPPIHVGVMTALQTGKLDLLKYFLEIFSDVPERKDAQDEAGWCPFHRLIISGKINSTLGETVLRLLLNYGCNAGLRDQAGRLPKDLLHPNDTAYSLLSSASKPSIEVLKKKMEELKAEGNAAKKAGNLQQALRMYSEAIAITQDSKQLRKEAAILYTNRANVQNLLKRQTEALTDALAAINCDPSWHKGHYWHGLVLHSLGQLADAFDAFLRGQTQTQSVSLLVEAASTVCLIPGRKRDPCYKRLLAVDKKLWPQVIEKVGKAADWRALACLVMGPDYEQMKLNKKISVVTDDLIESFCRGVAGQCPSKDVSMATVFQFLKREDPKKVGNWLDLMLYIMVYKSDMELLGTIREYDEDTPLHACVRFSLMTGKTSLLEEFPGPALLEADTEMCNGLGDCVFHTITKFRPPPEESLLRRVTDMLLKKGMSMHVKDSTGRLPVDYLDNVYSGRMFEFFLKASKKDALKDVEGLKEEGNRLYKSGQVAEAIRYYSNAIQIFKSSGAQAAHARLSGRDVATLYGNRAEAYMKLGDFKAALEDSLECVGHDGHWYKAHYRVGRALRGLGKAEEAMRAFINTYKDVPSGEDKAKIELMMDLVKVCAGIPRNKIDFHKRFPEFPPREGHLWARAAYQLVCQKSWDVATICIFQFKASETVKGSAPENLRPLCNLTMLKGYAWGLDLMRYFLECGSNRTTISLVDKDTYLHAVVRLTLTIAKEISFLTFVLQKYVKPNREHGLLDGYGNTALHAATKEKGVQKQHRYNVVLALLNCGVDANHHNQSGLQAIDLLDKSETNTNEILRMKMYNARSSKQAAKPEGKAAPGKAQNGRQNTPPIVKEKTPPVVSLKGTARECDECDDMLTQAAIHVKEGETLEAHGLCTQLLTSDHKTERHEARAQKAVSVIVGILSATATPEIPPCLTDIHVEFYRMIIDKLATGNKWRQLDAVVRRHRTRHSSDQLKGFAREMSIVPVIMDTSLKEEEELKRRILSNLLNNKASMGSDGSQAAVRHAIAAGHFRVVIDLLTRDADHRALSLYDGDTPLHAALLIALEKEKGNTVILEKLLKLYKTDPTKYPELNPESLDKNGDCLYHLAAKAKSNNTSLKLTELLCNQNLSSSFYNKERKLPVHYVTKKNDRRLQFLRLAASFEPTTPQNRKKEGSDTDDVADDDLQQFARPAEADGGFQAATEVVKTVSQKEARKRRIEETVRLLPDSKVSIFSAEYSPTKQKQPKPSSDAVGSPIGTTVTNTPVPEQEPKSASHDGTKMAANATASKPDKLLEVENLDSAVGDGGAMETVARETEEGLEDDVPDLVADESDDEEAELAEEEAEFEIDAQVFDNLEWEVECTAEVWKTLRDKHVVPELKQRIVHKIQLLASGDWQPHLCKRIHNVPPSLNLFEAKFSKGSRIMWELAVAFSPRLSESAERRLQTDEGEITHPVVGGRIYSEIIRVWDIVLDHDKIYRSVQRIKKSHNRGEMCIIQKKLQGIQRPNINQPAFRYPKLFAESEVPFEVLQERRQELKQFFPPASANETEYHILKFYSFSSTLVSHVLQNIQTKVDFPFRVTDLEHAIIHLQTKAPILLLGRSGTGKTTCCLYRLWSQFHSYWLKAKEAEAPLLPRCIEFIHQENEELESEDEDSQDTGDESDLEDAAEDALGACGGESGLEEVPDAASGQQYDHIHQIFITKNAVLCSEVQKNFNELSHADDLMRNHLEHEAANLPNRLQDVEDLAYPLFLTSRQLLLLLDASIGEPYFFDRKEDGSLKVNIQGWTDGDGPLSILPLLDEDSDEEEGEEQHEEGYYDDQDEVNIGHVGTKKLKVDPRREITYEVFVEEVWPRIKKKMRVTYHPSLVWVEIMSFIKGSYEALSKPYGYLEKEEYIKLGRKRAPNFSGERDKVFEFFLRYEHFKKQNSLFDETDLVYDTFRRLRNLKTREWVIHQIFVDETQDFTQGELCLLIRLCQNPNEMFLTGDTAQSIMRGIAFRFSDLRSLFYHARHSMQAMGKTSAVEVPKKVHQLTHNYRSHAGILSLASSILELMVEFFPESFDRLRKDQGLFHGPQPILLESCSFSDLAVLLRGNRRKTSHIEFGAHQAILVVNDSAREAIPEELRMGLVLTIYEAKGLEFDDVLIYNFFKDSQASKEWRVVTDFLERLLASREEAGDQPSSENLVEIDADVLKEDNRPRPLNFDPNLHKVLNSELKHLYTALTRARVNVWIFDEDMDKRAPMFEYFKARKLVKSLTVSEVNESSLSETMFAEKSSEADWIRRGEDFMRNSLYGVAAKCFGMAGDVTRQKVALAHGQALKASRLKDNPRRMREEFLIAAEMYLECDKPGKAAICLQNARERELAAQLFEKLGQYDKAADTYRKMKRPLASSRCYEQLGQFDRAMEVLYENESYDLAIDTLRRYEKLVEEMAARKSPVLQTLLEHKPNVEYTEDRLSYRAAELNHRYKNEVRMLEALERLPRVDDRVQFLKSKGSTYVGHAARILEDNDRTKEAVKLFLMYERIDDAVDAARRTMNEDIIADSLLVASRVLMHKKDVPKKIIVSNLKEAQGLFKDTLNSDGFGEVCLYLTQLTGDETLLRDCWRAFERSKNEAGLIECTDILVRSSLLETNLAACKSAVRGVEYLFNVACNLLKPDTAAKKEKAMQLVRFYGLVPSTSTTYSLHPREKPMCLEMVKDLFSSKEDRKKPVINDIPSAAACEKIVASLLARSQRWLFPIWTCLEKFRVLRRQCQYYMVGSVCPQEGDVDTPCRSLHRPMTGNDFKELVEIDSLLVEFECNVQHGAAELKRVCPVGLKPAADFYLVSKETESPLWKYESCKVLWQDLMPDHQQPLILAEKSEIVLNDLSSNQKIREHLRNYLKELWNLASPAGERRKFKTMAVRSTDTFLKLMFGMRLFRLERELNPASELRKLEMALTDEMGGKKKDYDKIMRYYTLMGQKTEYGWAVQCIARRFLDAFSLLTSLSQNPYEAIFKFSKFTILLAERKRYEFLPSRSQLLLWLEFYSTLCFLVIAKMQVKYFSEFLFVIPANYIAVLKFVEASFPKGAIPVEELVHRWVPWRSQTAAMMQERLKFITYMVYGAYTTINLVADAFGSNCQHPGDFALAERTLLLALTLVSNVGKSLSVDCEAHLMGTLCSLQVPRGAPDRLQHAVKAVYNARGLADVAGALMSLLEARGEKCFVCQWVTGSKQHLQKVALENVGLFSKTFLDDRTAEVMRQPSVTRSFDPQMELEDLEHGEMTEDELRTHERDRESHRMESERNRAAQVIGRCYRAYCLRTQVKTLKARVERELLRTEGQEHHEIFVAVQVDATMCGICGFSFEGKMFELLERERTYAKSVSGFSDNAMATASSPEVMASTADGWPRTGGVQSPQGSSHQQPNYFVRSQSVEDGSSQTQGGWGQSQGQGQDLPPVEVRQAKLKKIRTDHEESMSHMQKSQEFRGFRRMCLDHIFPKLEEVRLLLSNQKYGISDPQKQASLYSRVDLDINQMMRQAVALDYKIQTVVAERAWGQAQLVYQMSEELKGTFHIVKPHVEEVQERLRQEEEERVEQRAAFASTMAPRGEDWEEEQIEDIEEVVPEPQQKVRSMEFRNKGRNRRRGRRYYQS